MVTSRFLECRHLIAQTDGKQILSRADLEALPQVKVTASEHGSLPLNFEGVTLPSVLEKAEALPEFGLVGSASTPKIVDVQ